MDAKAQERHVVAEFECEPANAQRVGELLAELLGPARREEGCLYYDLYRRIDEPTKFYILDGWRDQTALDGHGRHPNVTRVVEAMQPLLSKPIAITVTARLSDPN